MGTQKQAFLVLSFCLFTACGNSTASDGKQTTKEAQDFRKYATAICLGASFREQAVMADANRSANVYLGNVDLAAYEALRNQLKTWKLDGFTTKNDAQAAIARCFEFSESDEVRNIFQQFDPCEKNDTWLDQDDFKTQCR